MKAWTAQILQLLLEDQRWMATLATSCLTARQTGHTHKGNKQLMTMSRSQRRSASRGIGLHRLPLEWEHIKSLMLRTQLTSVPVPTEPFREVVCQYTDTQCTTQKQTNLTNSLLQNIAIFNEHNSTKLEEWLMDIETADLISESWAKLTKAKRINTHTSHGSYQFWENMGWNQGFTYTV